MQPCQCFRRSLALVAFAAVCLAGAAAAQPAAQVADINTSRTGGIGDPSFPIFNTTFVEVGGQILVPVNDGIHGLELWRTDGTVAGTGLVADICPGACSPRIFWLTVLGDAVYFAADDGIHGRELWRSDGTAAGTRMVVDLRPGFLDSSPIGLFAFGGTLYFGADDGVHGRELWRTDGTAAGTVLVKDIEPGPQGSSPLVWAALGTKVVFTAQDSAHGEELWTTDGTPGGTSLLEDIDPGGGSGVVFQANFPTSPIFAITGGQLFFSADDGTSGSELWVTDGTPAGTVQVKDIAPGSEGSLPRGFAVLDGRVYFAASDSFATGHGVELWVSDGTEAGTTMVKDINPGLASSIPLEIVPFAGGLAFHASDGVHGAELWWSDGTEAGTKMVKDIAPGPTSGLDFFTWAVPTVVGSELLFFADDGVHGLEPWRSDGTEAGTQLLADIAPGPAPSGTRRRFFAPDLTVVRGGRWYFRAGTSVDGAEVWTSDGTTAGTVELEEIDNQASAFQVGFTGTVLVDRSLADLGGTLLFGADDGIDGNELWRSDGTAAGTTEIKDIVPGSNPSFPASITPAGSRAFFVPFGTFDRTLWASDGTGSGTVLVKDFTVAGSSCCAPEGLASLGDTLFFSADSGSPTGEELWKSDGSSAGTAPLRTLADESSLLPRWLTPFGGRLFYAAGGTAGGELWSTDGTPGGTGVVRDILAGPGSSDPQAMTAIGPQLFFAAVGAGTGRELWRSDGTSAGTVLVKDIRPGAESGLNPQVFNRDLGEIFAAAGGRAVFAADDGAVGEEPWVSDGTEAGTSLLRDIRPGGGSSEIRQLTSAGGRAFFVADDGVHGWEPWVSDGTPAGTLLLADILAGGASSHPQHFRAVGDLLLFAADDGVHGLEPWVSDGTPSGTFLLQDVAPGELPSSAQAFTLSGGQVYFVANDGVRGFELWSMAQQDLVLLVSADLGVAIDPVPATVVPGGLLTYTITLGNRGPLPAVDAAWTAVLPADLTFLSLDVPAGWSCSTPPMGSTGTVTCSHPIFGLTEAVFMLRAQVSRRAPTGSSLVLAVDAAAVTAEGSPGDETARVATPVVEAPQVVEIPTLGSAALGLLALFLAGFALLRLTRSRA